MIKPWKPKPGDPYPYRDVTLAPFQVLFGTRLCGRVTVDARGLDPREHEKLKTWIAEAVCCRLTKDAVLTVLDHGR